MDHYYHNASGSVVGGSGGGAAPAYHQQLPIAPSPVTATAGQKRKLVSSSSTTAVTGASTTAAQTAKSGSISRHGTAPAIIDSPVAAPAGTPSNTSPSDYWKGLLKEWNVPILDTVGIEADDVDEKVNFLETTLDRIEAYQNIDLLAAVRRRDIPTLKRIAAEHAAKNSTMNACNRFGESILHLACRKGSLDVVELLVGGLPGCDCSLLVRDDYGRTVLHDACWTINPPWELIKLILKKAPVLWRVSDVRGHLAVQYIPKSAWPQWTAFLTKNKELLERIMVHSYHGVDIAKPSQSAPSADATSSTTTNKSSTETTTVPQHQQQVQPPPQPQFSKPLPATVPVSAHNSSSSIQGAAAAAESSTISAADASKAAVTQRHAAAKESMSVALALATGGGMAQASAEQANAVVARALAQANPAMVQALSQGAQHRKLEQGVQSVESSLVSSSRSPQQTRPAVPMKVVPAPGPATAALDEALKAQSKARTLQRSEQKQQPPAQLAHKPPAAAEQSATSPTKHSPLPYAPSISMIAERLAGYQKAASARKDQQQKQQQEEQPTGAESTSPKQAAVVVPNPLPAVPNPLLTSTENMAVKQGQEPTTPEATTVNVPNPMAGAGESSLQHTSEEATAGSDGDDDDDDREEQQQHSNSNSMSDVTMSASPSVVEISSSSNAATDTDNSEDASPDATTTDNEQKEADQHDSGSSNNAKKTGKLVVG